MHRARHYLFVGIANDHDGLRFMKDIPFDDVYIYATVLDE